MKLRKEIPEQYKWDIELFKTKEEIEEALKAFERLTNSANKYYGKFNDPNVFFDYYYEHQKDSLLVSQLYFYVGNMLSVEGSNVEMKKLMERLEVLSAKNSKAYSYVSPQQSKLSTTYLKSLLADTRAKDIDNSIKSLIISKKHSIDEKTSKVISNLNRAFNDTSSIFDILTDMEMTFEDAVDSEGKPHTVSDATYGELISSTDRILRQNAFNSLMNGYGKLNQTFHALYTKDIKADNDFAKLYKYKNVLDETLFDYIPEKVFRNNIKFVEKNIPLLQDFIKILNKTSNLSDFSYFDLFEDKKINGDISIEEAQKIILSALAPLGEEYVSLVKKKFSDKSIDYLPNKDKASGAYCSNCYGAKTLILMNYLNDFNSVSTLIHEMGHCINAEYFNANQPMQKADIPIFAAEIASTVNEILLNLYMQKNCKPEEKAYYIKMLLNDARSTIFRQTLFTEFELFAHESIENEQPVTNEDFNKKYYELNQKYYGNACILPENLKFEWSRIPHFYRPYYVFSYSTGLITAITIAQKLLTEKDFNEKYIHFLKNGTDKKPIEILKEIGIDLTSEKPFISAFKFLSEQLKEYKSLCK